MRTIKGGDIAFQLNNKSVYHAISHEVTVSSEFEEWETKDSDGKQNEFSGISGTASANGVACISDTGDTEETYDSSALLEAQLSGESVALSVNIGSKTYTGTAWIDSVSLAGEISKKATWNVSLKFFNLTKSK